MWGQTDPATGARTLHATFRDAGGRFEGDQALGIPGTGGGPQLVTSATGEIPLIDMSIVTQADGSTANRPFMGLTGSTRQRRFGRPTELPGYRVFGGPALTMNARGDALLTATGDDGHAVTVRRRAPYGAFGREVDLTAATVTPGDHRSRLRNVALDRSGNADVQWTEATSKTTWTGRDAPVLTFASDVVEPGAVDLDAGVWPVAPPLVHDEPVPGPGDPPTHITVAVSRVPGLAGEPRLQAKVACSQACIGSLDGVLTVPGGRAIKLPAVSVSLDRPAVATVTLPPPACGAHGAARRAGAAAGEHRLGRPPALPPPRPRLRRARHGADRGRLADVPPALRRGSPRGLAKRGAGLAALGLSGQVGLHQDVAVGDRPALPAAQAADVHHHVRDEDHGEDDRQAEHAVVPTPWPPVRLSGSPPACRPARPDA